MKKFELVNRTTAPKEFLCEPTVRVRAHEKVEITEAQYKHQAIQKALRQGAIRVVINTEKAAPTPAPVIPESKGFETVTKDTPTDPVDPPKKPVEKVDDEEASDDEDPVGKSHSGTTRRSRRNRS